ncbi:hypothetical protein [Suttonella ornithocola]|uniref:hypothetical protein n=1 Tax=Suttonella ornithocola TaxID=279832 RepID=UPI000E1B5653|nr:hypothetical protein [Suttonella ornithocola]
MFSEQTESHAVALGIFKRFRAATWARQYDALCALANGRFMPFEEESEQEDCCCVLESSVIFWLGQAMQRML